MPRKKKKSKNKKQKKDVEYDKDKAGSYSISELEAFSETLLQELEVIDQELKARQSEREMYSEVSDLLNIEKVLSALYEAKSTGPNPNPKEPYLTLTLTVTLNLTLTCLA